MPDFLKPGGEVVLNSVKLIEKTKTRSRNVTENA